MKPLTEILEGRKAFQLYYHPLVATLEMLNDEQSGKLFKAIVKYSTDGVITSFEDDILSLAFNQQKVALDNNTEKYIEKSLKNSENAKKGWDKRKGKYNANASDGNPFHSIDADIDNDIDNDIDIGIDTDLVNELDFGYQGYIP